uniref:DNA helicase n=1 Tax=Blastobotrys adeninivorans TaxID=409370 RepID=A0A060T056_BLAAD
MTPRAKLVTQLSEALAQEQLVDVDETSQLIKSLTPKQLALRGLAVLNLISGSMRTGLGGKVIHELEIDPAIANGDQSIDSGEVRTGDIVKVAKMKGKEDEYAEGVVVKSSSKGISVALEEKYENVELDGRLWLVKLTNTSTYKRMQYALNDLSNDEPSRLINIVLGNEKPLIERKEDFDFLDETLNDSQKEAIRYALGSELSVIHGPPGTGKTYTVIEIVRQLVKSGKRVLVCGPSNISVDNILERLTGHVSGDKLIRIGHPARLLQSNLLHSLEIVSRTSDQGQIVQDVRNDIDAQVRKISKTRNGRERRAIFQELKELRKEYRIREKSVLYNLILQAQVVVSTLHGAGSRSIRDAYTQTNGKLFDAIIIDEVSQALEPQCWIPLTVCPKTPKLIVAGDNKQLPPTIKIKDNNKYRKSLETTLFDRLVKVHGDDIRKMLIMQYRMNNQIMAFPSLACYGSKLQAAKSVAERTLANTLKHVDEADETTTPVFWYDTQGDDFMETVIDDGLSNSKQNDNEAQLVASYVKKLLDAGVHQSDIGVITPYSAQTALIKTVLQDYPEIEVSTVDGFQGREKNCIIMSLVRSNDKNEVGFLADERRLNVAMTRPKMHLCVIGNMETISSDKFMKRWVEWIEDNADIEYPDLSSL